MTHIVEYVGREGVISTDVNYPAHRRLERPHAGDIIQWADGTRGMVDEVGSDDPATWPPPGKLHIVVRTPRAYLGLLPQPQSVPSTRATRRARVYVRTSGGPYTTVDVTECRWLTFGYADFWNWGDNSPGADRGCEYRLLRPVFLIDKEPPA